jgi:CAAX prenyl protease-like protein
LGDGMTASNESPQTGEQTRVVPTSWRGRIDRWVEARPDMPYLVPFMTFLALMAIGALLSEAKRLEYLPHLYALRTFGTAAVCLVFWKYWPPLGKAHIVPAVVFGLLTTVMWIGVHDWMAQFDWYPKTQLMGPDATPDKYYDPYARLGGGLALWLFLVVRIGGAAIVVPIVEEIFWRGWVLRVLINPYNFRAVALGTFTLRSFVICSLASALEHPMWEVGILCWALWNLLFYWKKSLLFMMVMHGVTNFALYTWVVWAQRWVYWS